MFFRRKRNIINNQMIKIRTDKIAKKIKRDVKKKIKKGELVDPKSFSLYLNYIDAEYNHIKADIKDATMTANYEVVRRARLNDAREIIAFYNSRFAELRNLRSELIQQAKALGKTENLKDELTTPPEIEKLRTKLAILSGETVARKTAPVRRPVAVNTAPTAQNRQTRRII